MRAHATCSFLRKLLMGCTDKKAGRLIVKRPARTSLL